MNDTPMNVFDRMAPIEHDTLGGKVYNYLQEMLVSGQVAPGDKLAIRDTASALGVSMTPVREAMGRLIGLGVLESSQSRTVRVPILTRSRFREVTMIRVEIEGFAAENACKVATEADLVKISAAEKAFRQALEEKDMPLLQITRLNRDFHFALYEAANMATLMEIIISLWLKVGPVLHVDARLNRERVVNGSSVACHRDAMEGLRVRDSSAVRRAIAQDIEQSAQFFLDRGGLPG